MRTRLVGILALAGLGLIACGGGDGGNGNSPTPGTLTVALTAQSSAPGAVMFTVSGGGISGMTVSGGYHLYATTLSGTSRRVLITGNVTAGSLVTIAVPDIGKAAQYSVTVNQVSARSTAAIPYQQLAVGGFAIDVQ
ncbi:MAG: hypothetical protein ABI836_09725 [Gemmatimonadota bacterium]